MDFNCKADNTVNRGSKATQQCWWRRSWSAIMKKCLYRIWLTCKLAPHPGPLSSDLVFMTCLVRTLSGHLFSGYWSPKTLSPSKSCMRIRMLIFLNFGLSTNINELFSNMFTLIAQLDCQNKSFSRAQSQHALNIPSSNKMISKQSFPHFPTNSSRSGMSKDDPSGFPLCLQKICSRAQRSP